MECEIYSLQNIRMVSAMCELLETLALPKEIDETLTELQFTCAKYMDMSNLVGKDINADE